MAEKHVQNTKYKYDLNASLVQQQRHTAQVVEAGVGDGSGQTLVGQKIAKFGDRVTYNKPDELQEKALKKLKEKGLRTSNKQHLPDQNVLHVQISQDELIYRPRTRETKAAYEQMLQIVGNLIGDQPLEILKGALDEIIAILKQDLKESERKGEIEVLVDKLTEADFSQLTVLGQCLVDYQVQENTAQEMQTEEVQVDPEMNFSGSEESDFEDVYEVKDGIVEDQDQWQQQESEAEELPPRLETNSALPTDTTMSLKQIDAQWLNRQLSEQFLDSKSPEELLKLEAQILDLLGQESTNQRDCEKRLLQLVGHKKFSFVRILLKQRFAVYFGTLLNQALTKSERDKILTQIQNSEYGRLLLQQPTTKQIVSSIEIEKSKNWQATDAQIQKNAPWLNEKVVVDLEKLKFKDSGRLMSNKKCHLPKGSTKQQKQGYDEISVPAIRHAIKPDEKLIPISSMPQWTHNAFPKDMTTLNIIQSRLYETAFKTPENLLICAPTGAGKTNIAMLTILQCLDSRRRSNNTIDTKQFKIVYIAPMKALVSEVVGNFQRRLQDYGIIVRELTGDTHLTRQQIEETQIIVTTPEKWDIITRKSGERAYVDLVKLLIIDEVHLLHDSRGPVLEAIIARTIRQIEQTSEFIRIVALSATLPNYQDVAAFLRVKKTGLFYFDNSYRPVPLEQIYIGVSEKKAIKRLILMNEILYEKVIERAGKHQILVFTHSRKETAKTAKVIRDIALQQDQLSKFLKKDSASKEILLAQVDLCDSQDLKDVLPFGIGLHHAGMSKRDRKMVEDLFAQGCLSLLCSTATLAWGVNLPAHTVIIKGTQIYSPEQGKWIELSPQDVLQMMGRAGRPQYDSVGEGIILTNQSELQYYLSLNNMQLPIESQMVSQLADQMSAEIVLGTISNVKEAVNWLAYTYLYVRMIRNPSLYGIDSSAVQADDPTLIGRRQELVYSAATLLQKSHMIKFDKTTGALQATALGKIAAHYYIKCESMQTYAENMKPHMNSIDLFRLFSLSKEFQYIPIRENEKLELVKFVERVPIPVKGSLDEPSTKINILLQAYISRFKMDGYDINADMVYVSQNSGRIMRALFEIALRKNWAQLSEQLLNLCKICEKRLWNSMTPLRQFSQMPNLEEIARKLEKKAQLQWQHFYEMSSQQLGEIVGMPKLGRTIQIYINKFPRIELEAYVQPLTRTMLRIELYLKTHKDFTWDSKYHGTAEPFWILIHDSDSETILHLEQFVLKEQTCHEDHRLSFTVGLHEPMPPQYFVKVISDRWMHAETSLPISFKHLILPDRFPAPTPLQDMYPKLVKDLQFADVEKMYHKDGVREFNTIQTQVFDKVYHSRDSVFIGAPSGSGRQTIVEMAIFQELQDEEGGKVLYLAPKDLICQNVHSNWQKRMSQDLGLSIVVLDGNQPFTQQAQQISIADVIIATPQVWESVSRRWRQRKIIHQITLCVFDYLQLLTPEYEIVVSRSRMIQNELKDQVLDGKSKPRSLRIIGLSCPIANGTDLAQWLGVSVNPETGGYFNFSPSVRPRALNPSMLTYDQFNRSNRLLAMARPAFNAVKKHQSGLQSKSVVFVSDRKQTRLTALDFVTFTAADENSKQFLSEEIDQTVLNKISEKTLQSCLEYGIGFIHDGMTEREMHTIRQLFRQNKIRLIVVSQQFCWDVADLDCHLVIIMDAERFDGVERKYVEYDIPSVLQMQSLASLSLETPTGSLAPKFLLMVYSAHKDYFVKFLQEPLPLESQLADNLHDFLNTEIVASTITTKQEAVDWLTWTFLFRRLAPNPNFYNLNGRTPQNINDFISQLVEDTIEDLVNSKCTIVDEETELDLSAANLGRIAAFYGVQYQTIGLFAKYLDDENFLQQKIKSLLEVLSKSSEFGQLPIRESEEALISTIAQHMTYAPPAQTEVNTTSVKTSILLQAHFDRKPLPTDLSLDQKFILLEVKKLVHAMTDVISTNGYLSASLQCMELSQMCVQAMWPRQSPLLQLPQFNQDLIDQLNKVQVYDVSDFMNMDDDQRNQILQISETEMQRLASVCNRYPVLEMSYKLSQEQYSLEEKIVIYVELKRADDDEESLAVFDSPVFAQYFPQKRYEEWWLVIGHVKSNKLLAIKKLTNFRGVKQIEAQLNFNLESGGDYIKDGFQIANLQLYLICDSYVGADLQENIPIKLQA